MGASEAPRQTSLLWDQMSQLSLQADRAGPPHPHLSTVNNLLHSPIQPQLPPKSYFPQLPPNLGYEPQNTHCGSLKPPVFAHCPKQPPRRTSCNKSVGVGGRHKFTGQEEASLKRWHWSPVLKGRYYLARRWGETELGRKDISGAGDREPKLKAEAAEISGTVVIPLKTVGTSIMELAEGLAG